MEEGFNPGHGLGAPAQEPDKITVIVHGGKNLKSKKKGRCKFSVIFGLGSQKFRTDVVEDVFGSPVWHTEADIDVNDASQPLTLTATEKDDVLGQIIIPLNELPNLKPYQGKKVALGPHKKCPEPVGEIMISAWVTAMRTPREPKSSPSGALKGLKKMKSKITQSPLLRRKGSMSKEGSSPGSLRGAMSMGDLMYSGKKNRKSSVPNLMSVPSDSMGSINSTDSDASNQYSALDIRESLMRPEVSGISPKEGSVNGGTRITIRGINLGRSKEDILTLTVAGADCLPTLEYESNSKLFCSTPKWKPCSGDIVIQTTSGGVGTSMVQFAFTVKDGDSVSPLPTKRLSPLVTPRISPMTHRKKGSDTSMLSTGSMNQSIPEEDDLRPEVSGISPRDGPMEGGTRLTIRGENLGLNKEDIVTLFVCGKDCTSAVEYESSRKLYVTTKAWKPGTGDIIVETQSGGKGMSSVQFTYTIPKTEVSPPSPVTMRNIERSMDGDLEKFNRYSAPSPAFSSDDDDDNLLKPEVTGISPREGSLEGGTKLTIRGINLGAHRGDVTGLTICGANCLPMMEYESPMKLHCTTPPWKPGQGAIVVETRMGGKGSSLVQFTFKDIPAPRVKHAPAQEITPKGSQSLPSTVSVPSKPPRRSMSSSGSHSTSSSPAPGRILPEPPITSSTPARPDPQATMTSQSNMDPSPSQGKASPEPTLGLSSSYSSPSPEPKKASPGQKGVHLPDVTLDETDDFVGATPYPDEGASGNIGSTNSSVSAAPTGTPNPTSSRFSHSHVTMDTTPTSISDQHSTRGHESRPQPLGQEVAAVTRSPTKERKRAAPPPPGFEKPPPYPTEQKAKPAHQGSESGRQVTVNVHSPQEMNRANTDRNNDYNNLGPNIYGKVIGPEKMEMFIKDQQQQQQQKQQEDKERETQSGPTRQELMEEIRRVKLENRDLREQNRTMTQYMESILASVMTRCPEILCVDHGAPK